MQVKYLDFVTKLNSQMFQSHTEAKHELTKLLGTTFAKAFIHWGVRLTFFTTLYTLTTNILASYNDSVAIWNFSASGCLTGTIYRIPLGLRAMVVAGTVGGFIGTIAGCSCVFILYMFGTKYDDIQDWHYKARNMRIEKMKEVGDELKNLK
uniref:Complex I assembly factor TIMMDC1, mitochondrial n=1 Tax=Cacopsylla melanoneura TaxID=428564 RepID=A0A8D9BUU9_9HEMI